MSFSKYLKETLGGGNKRFYVVDLDKKDMVAAYDDLPQIMNAYNNYSQKGNMMLVYIDANELNPLLAELGNEKAAGL